MLQKAKPPRRWAAVDVIDYFDTHLNCTIRELAAMSGWRVVEVKALLSGG